VTPTPAVPFLLHHFIDEAAARTPQHQAFRFDGQALSYADLVARANRLAHLLMAEGVRRHDRVGIYMTKGLDLPVAIYGILKAGAAYVPIDPAAPPARVAFILQDCGIRQIVTNAERATRAARIAADVPSIACIVGASSPGPSAATRFVPWEALAGFPADAPDVRLVDDDLAYIMYTSGSTGVPKGLMHTHASGRAYATLSAREYGVRPDDRLGNHSPLHFDMSTFEFLTGPLCGATTVIISEEATLFPRSLAELIERERLTFWYSVPLALIQLLELGALEERDLSSLRWVLFGGEPFPPKHLARLATLWPHARFSNSYGPAEVNQCTSYHVPQGPIDPDMPLPIGRAWPGAEALIVGDDGQRVTTGDTGELLIRSSTMMRGYWARPDLNRQAFLRQALFSDYELVFYRTGDLVREREDGNLLFLGRRDRQIKIRGYRVELEEVEAVISALPGVAEAAAVDVRDDDGVTIVAAVILDSDAAIDADTIRRGAAARLPPYAVPSRIDIRATLPRTGSGKADRPALRAEFRSALR
jgi:amino acid adenylation domain-containing protein